MEYLGQSITFPPNKAKQKVIKRLLNSLKKYSVLTQSEMTLPSLVCCLPSRSIKSQIYLKVDNPLHTVSSPS